MLCRRGVSYLRLLSLLATNAMTCLVLGSVVGLLGGGSPPLMFLLLFALRTLLVILGLQANPSVSTIYIGLLTISFLLNEKRADIGTLAKNEQDNFKQ
jgi:hypothetical protein